MRIVNILGISILIVVGYFFIQEIPHKITIKDTQVSVRIADNKLERSRGLSGVKELKENSGMLFVFEQEDFHYFWMKNMYISLDIIWMNQEYVVVDITEDINPDTYPQKFTSQVPAQYVLEVEADFIQKNNILIGDVVQR